MSSRDSIRAGKRPNHPATAASSWPGKIQRTSRLRTASVTWLSGGAAVIAKCSCPPCRPIPCADAARMQRRPSRISHAGFGDYPSRGDGVNKRFVVALVLVGVGGGGSGDGLVEHVGAAQ